MCPYSRFQSAMFDKKTLIISYDETRGEPRGKHKAGESWLNKGHCVDCDQCVAVCPMGIDIREGLQMECIACGLCVDACNTVMEKVGLPKGLIRYDTEHAKGESIQAKLEFFRPRTFWYLVILSIVGGIMLYSLATRSPLDLTVIHDRNPLFVKMSDGAIRNGYALNIFNKAHEDREFKIEVIGIENIIVKVQANHDTAVDHLSVFADSSGHYRVFVTAQPQNEHRKDIEFRITDTKTKQQDSKRTIFVSRDK